jgi:serine/threonine protein kinase
MSDAPPPTSDAAMPQDSAPEPDDDAITIPIDSLSDEAPTIISRVPPTESFAPPAASDAVAFTSNVRGRTLAHFELLDPIGVGGMAAVIRARDKQLDRFVALKILPPEMATDPEHVQRFHQEARAAAKLDHENIARVYFCGEDQKLHFIAFEFVEGSNLRTLMERRGRLPVREAVHYMLQIATGLAHAASRGVVHRDIKPSNIIITPSGRAKLVDMGLARSLEPHDNRQLTQSGVTLGTFDYISPEQALEPREADVRSDIYSLGCTFYHMLTGQTSVPEGTAAKKLHHHQHVAPIDPRQLNPDIPDDVAAILQRMMAKDPNDRYARAEHLVQHLIQVAQKLGGVEASEGVLFVDSPLPSGPRKRPVLLGGIATGVLGAFVLVVALVPPHSTSSTPGKKPALEPNKKDDLAGKKWPGGAPDQTKDGDHAFHTRSVGSVGDLTDALAQAEERSLTVVIDRSLNLGKTALTYRGSSNHKLVVEGAGDGGEPIKVQSTYPWRPENPSSEWAGLTIYGGTVVFKNLHFEIASAGTPQMLVAGVLVKSGNVTFENCTFSQRTPQGELISQAGLKPVASVAVAGRGSGIPFLGLTKCYFQSGQAAVSLKGSVRLKQDNCAMGGHACMFHVWGQNTTDVPAEVALNHVSGHVLDGPVFRLDDNVSCKLRVSYSIFSCPDTVPAQNGPNLIRQSSKVPNVRYEGKRNAYHNLPNLWAGTEPARNIKDLVSFKNKSVPGSDEDSNFLPYDVKPWDTGSADGPGGGFRINPKLPQLRYSEEDGTPIGVSICAWGAVNHKPLPAPDYPRAGDPIAVKAPFRVVDPSATGNRIYKNVTSAISESDPGDVIQIKYNGELKIQPVKLIGGQNVKLVPYPDYHPILVLGKTTEKDKDTALFHVSQSQIEFERLEFRLRPDGGYEKLAIVSLGGNSVCQFRHCVVTLDDSKNPGVYLDVITLLDPASAMKMTTPEPRTRPELVLKNCFIRGGGNLLGVRASRPFDLNMEQCLVCLGGSLVQIEASAMDQMPLDAKAQITLKSLTTWMSEPVLQLRSGKNGRGLAATQVYADHCHFAAAANKSLVRVQFLDNEEQAKKLLNWMGSSNAYSGYAKLLDQPTGSDGMPLVFYEDQWKKFTRDDGAQTLYKDAVYPLDGVDRAFHSVLPDVDLPTLKSELANYGAAFNQLPRSTVESIDE